MSKNFDTHFKAYLDRFPNVPVGIYIDMLNALCQAQVGILDEHEFRQRVLDKARGDLAAEAMAIKLIEEHAPIAIRG